MARRPSYDRGSLWQRRLREVEESSEKPYWKGPEHRLAKRMMKKGRRERAAEEREVEVAEIVEQIKQSFNVNDVTELEVRAESISNEWYPIEGVEQKSGAIFVAGRRYCSVFAFTYIPPTIEFRRKTKDEK